MEKNKEKLVLDNMNLAYSVAHRYKDRVSNSLDIDDIKQICLEGLIYAANTFDDSRGIAFSTYAHTVIKNYLIDNSVEECKITKNNNITSLDEPTEEELNLVAIIPDNFDLEMCVIQKNNVELLYKYIHELPDLQKSIFLLRCKSKTFTEISILLDTDSNTIHLQYQKGLNALRDKFKEDDYE